MDFVIKRSYVFANFIYIASENKDFLENGEDSPHFVITYLWGLVESSLNLFVLALEFRGHLTDSPE